MAQISSFAYSQLIRCMTTTFLYPFSVFTHSLKSPQDMNPIFRKEFQTDFYFLEGCGHKVGADAKNRKRMNTLDCKASLPKPFL